MYGLEIIAENVEDVENNMTRFVVLARDEEWANRSTDEEKIVTTRHRITLGGVEIPYTATAGTLLLKEEDGRPRASIFFVAYTRDGVKDVASRPVTFTFNGGPGSSSVWLHMGAFGPRRVAMDDEGMGAPPPGRFMSSTSGISARKMIPSSSNRPTNETMAACREIMPNRAA